MLHLFASGRHERLLTQAAGIVQRGAPASDRSDQGTPAVELQHGRRRLNPSGSSAWLRTVTFACAGMHVSPAQCPRMVKPQKKQRASGASLWVSVHSNAAPRSGHVKADNTPRQRPLCIHSPIRGASHRLVSTLVPFLSRATTSMLADLCRPLDAKQQCSNDVQGSDQG